jgi:hypothetical protein
VSEVERAALLKVRAPSALQCPQLRVLDVTAADSGVAQAAGYQLQVAKLQAELKKLKRSRGKTEQRKPYTLKQRASKYSMQADVVAMVGGAEHMEGFVNDVSRRYACGNERKLDSVEALAMLFDSKVSRRGYQELRRYIGDSLPPRKAYEAVMKDLAIELHELKDGAGAKVGYAVANPVDDVIKVHLQAYLDRNPEVAAGMQADDKVMVVQYKYGSDSFSIPRFDNTSFQCEQTLLTLLLPDRKANSWMHSCPLAFIMRHKETPELLKIVNDYVDARLPRGESRFVDVKHSDTKTYRFELMDFRCGDAKAVAAEFGTLGVQATTNCWKCEERFGPFGDCLRPLHGFAGEGWKERKLADLFEWGAMVEPLKVWADANPLALKAKSTTTDPVMLAARATWATLVRETVGKHKQLEQALRSPHSLYYTVFDMNKLGSREPGDELAHIRKACFSMQMVPSALTELERVVMDVLHWTINIFADLLQWATDAAEQCNRLERVEDHKVDRVRELIAAITAIKGKKPMMGYEGIDSRDLMVRYMEWTEPLSAHPLYDEMMTVFSIFKRLAKTLWGSWEKDNAEMINDFAVDVRILVSHLTQYFSAPGAKCGKQCRCKVDVKDHWPGTKKKSTGNTYLKRKLSDSQVSRDEGAPEGDARGDVWFPVFKYGFYQHATYRHMLAFMQQYGSPMKYSSIVLEHANAVWKHIVTKRTAPGKGKSKDQAYVALTRFLLMTHPEIEKARPLKKQKVGGGVPQ